MYSLTPATVSIVSSITFLFLVGILFFAVAFFVMLYMFAWTYKDVIKHGKKLTVMFLISLSIPFTVGAITQQTNLMSQASTSAAVEDLQVERVEKDTVIVQFKTTEPVLAYLEYKNKNGEVTPILPTGSPNAKTDHYFRVPNVSGEGGQLYIVINGNKYTINGQPIQITQ